MSFASLSFVSPLSSRGNKTNCFPQGHAVIKCFVIPPNSKLEKNFEEIVCFSPAGSLPDFKPWRTRYESVNYGISNY